MLVVVAPDCRVHVNRIDVVDIVELHTVRTAGTRHIDAIAVSQDLHTLVNVIVFDHIVPAMEERFPLQPGFE